LKAVDTSVAVAAFGEWHDLNEEARLVLDQGAALAVHAYLETYAVLTGFPPPHRAPPALVDTWLRDRFLIILPPPEPEAQQAMVSTLAAAGRIGGSVYDGLIAAAVVMANLVLVTADERAARVYDLIGVNWEILQPAS